MSSIAVSIGKKGAPANTLAMFGFTMDWAQFAAGHMVNGFISEQVITWLRPFAGALYRYSGGNSFIWANAVSDPRKLINTDYTGMQLPVFGPGEFIDFLRRVNGRGVILLNIWDAPMTPEQAITDNLAYLAWLNARGYLSMVDYFELGNELDNLPGVTPDNYTALIKPFITQAKALYPGIKFAGVGKTGPWGGQGAYNWDASVAADVGTLVDAVTFHPYYDGDSIDTMVGCITGILNTYTPINPGIKVLVTEHAKWPANLSDQTTWAACSGTAGALSTADFILANLQNSGVSGACWQSLTTGGPWQLFHKDATTGALYPSPVYWALLTLREHVLPYGTEVSPTSVPGTTYDGGYDLRMVACSDPSGDVSLLGVNRGADSHTLVITGVAQKTIAKLNTLVGDAAGTDNTDASHNTFQMNLSYQVFDPAQPFSITIPPYTVFAVSFPADSLAAVTDWWQST